MEIPRHWRLKAQRYNLVGEECPHCEEKIFPPRDICLECSGNTKTPKITETPLLSNYPAELTQAARDYLVSGDLPPYVVREVAEEIHKWLNVKEWEAGYNDKNMQPWLVRQEQREMEKRLKISE